RTELQETRIESGERKPTRTILTPLLTKLRLDRSGLFILLLIIGGTGGIALWFLWNARHNSAIQFLPHRRPAEWIVYPSPFLGGARPRIELETKFRREFVLRHPPAKARLSWCGFKRCEVIVNDLPVVQQSPENWKQPETKEV